MRRDPLLVVLDEPTASLDPVSEAALFGRFAGAVQQARSRSGTVTLLVSHRLSTARIADLIVVLEAGRLVESGSHAELIAAGGTYAELFALQARGYASARWAGCRRAGEAVRRSGGQAVRRWGQ